MDQVTFDFHQTNLENKITTDEETQGWIKNNGSTPPVFVKNDTLEGAADIAGIEPENL